MKCSPVSSLTYICNEFTNSGDEATRALDHLNAEREQVEGDLSARHPDYLLRSQTFSTSAGRSPNRYSLPADIQKVRYLERVVSDSTADYERLWPVQQLTEKGDATFDAGGSTVMISGSSTGPPLCYLLGDDFWQIFPISDAVYTLRVWYAKRYADITASNDELNIVEYLSDVIVFGARIRIHDFLHLPTNDLTTELMLKKERALRALINRV